MKVAPNPPFWPLRPGVTARRVEFACWLVILVLGFALMSGRLSTAAGAPSAPSTPSTALTRPTSSAVFAGQEVGIFPRRCIRRVLDLTQQRSQADIVNEIERQCFTRPPHQSLTAVKVAPAATCSTAFGWRPSIVPSGVRGCLL